MAVGPRPEQRPLGPRYIYARRHAHPISQHDLQTLPFVDSLQSGHSVPQIQVHRDPEQKMSWVQNVAVIKGTKLLESAKLMIA